MPKVTLHIESTYDEMINFLKWNFSVQTKFIYNAFAKELTEQFIKEYNLPIEAYTRQAVRKIKAILLKAFDQHRIPYFIRQKEITVFTWPRSKFTRLFDELIHNLKREQAFYLNLSTDGLSTDSRIQILKAKSQLRSDLLRFEEIIRVNALIYQLNIDIFRAEMETLQLKGEFHQKSKSVNLFHFPLTRLLKESIEILIKFPNLKELNLKDSPLSFVDNSIKNLIQLEQLELSNTCLSDLSFLLGFSHFPKLSIDTFFSFSDINLEVQAKLVQHGYRVGTHGFGKWKLIPHIYPKKISHQSASSSSSHLLEREKTNLLSNKNLPEEFKEQLLKIEPKSSQDISALDNLIEEINFKHALYYQHKTSLGLRLSLNDTCSIGEISKFSFSEYGLTRLPEKLIDLFSKMPYLNELIFNNNYIHTIPPSINKIKKLRNLYISNNHISELPFTLGDLDLKILRLSDNKLKAIPDFFIKFKNLEVLHLSNNEISEINNVIFHLRNLEKFDIDHNQIEILPKDIGNLSYLNSFQIGYNRLRSLPPELSLLPINCLNHFVIQGNPFISLPRELRNQLIKTENHQFLPLLELHPDIQLEVTLKAALDLQIEEDLAFSFSSSVSLSAEGKDRKREGKAAQPMIFSPSMNEQRKKPLSRDHFLLALGIGVAAAVEVACYKRFLEP